MYIYVYIYIHINKLYLCCNDILLFVSARLLNFKHKKPIIKYFGKKNSVYIITHTLIIKSKIKYF